VAVAKMVWLSARCHGNLQQDPQYTAQARRPGKGETAGAGGNRMHRGSMELPGAMLLQVAIEIWRPPCMYS
jgi:hypothetical protein